MMGFALRPGISFCEIGDRLMFLDVSADRYFCLGSNAEQAFRALHIGDKYADTDGAIARMLKSGLLRLTEAEGKPLPCRGPVTPSNSLLDQTLPAPGARLRFAALCDLAKARHSVLRWPLHRVIEQLAARKLRTQVKGAGDADAPCRVAAAFDLTQALVRSHDQCLPRSLAVAHRLAILGVEAEFVIGVSLNPFTAHSWVQCGPSLVNDRLDSVRHFTPIFCL